MSRKACAEFLGVSLRTVRYWDAGRSRVPWAAVRLLRLTRLGDLGAMHDSWAGWIINRNGLWSPDGKHYPEPFMRRWWLTCEQARFFREAYDRETLGGVGATPLRARERVTLLPEAGMAAKQAAAERLPPIEADVTLTAFPGRRRQPTRGNAGSLSPVPARLDSAAAARSDAGLVSSSQQVERHRVRTSWRQRLTGVSHAW